jgi:hypothetical protein
MQPQKKNILSITDCTHVRDRERERERKKERKKERIDDAGIYECTLRLGSSTRIRQPRDRVGKKLPGSACYIMYGFIVREVLNVSVTLHTFTVSFYNSRVIKSRNLKLFLVIPLRPG